MAQAVSGAAAPYISEVIKQNAPDETSRDTEHANDSIGPIFDKEKEQKRLQSVQAISEIGGQAADIARTQGEINALEAAKKELGPLKENATEKERDAYLIALKNTDSYKAEREKSGTGSDIQRGIQAVTAALQGLAGGNIAGALAGASAPELARLLKPAEKDPAVNAIAHAILGGAVAAIQGNSAAAGAAGAAGAELAARAIMAVMYPGKTAGQLSEEEKQTVSALAIISAGMAGGLAGGSTSGAATGAQAGKNALENNSLSGNLARQTVKQAAESLKNQVRDKLGEGTTSSIANAIINGLADTGDAALGSADYVADAAMALAACAAGDSYCSRAMSDLSGKNQAVADSVKALMQSETWSAVKDTVVQASEGNQFALETTGGMLAGIILPGKKIPGVVKAVDPNIKIATGATVGDFEASLFKLPPGERVAIVKQTAAKVVAEHGLIKDNKLTKMNNRDVYRGTDGNLYALDTQHGRFEVVTPQGKHVMEVNFAMKEIPDSKDKSGGHNLRVK